MISILICGDYAPQNRIADMLTEKDYTFLDEVGLVTKTVDLSIVNLEAPVVIGQTKPIMKTGPALQCSPEAVEALKISGFDCVTLANNHFRDYGQTGVEDTIKTLEKYSIEYLGAGVNKKDSKKILYKTIKGKTIAVVNYCENEWSIASEARGGSNPLNPTLNYYDIIEAKKVADYVIAIIHGGVELYNLPTPRMKEWYRFFIDVGADIVVNHHQHCFSGYEIYKGSPIFYGLGNFCFDWNIQHTSLWNQGFMLKLILKDENVAFEMIPYIQCDKEALVSIKSVKYDSFGKQIERLNEIIADDNKLRDHFNELCNDGMRRFAPILFPYRNKYFRALAIRGLLPSFITKDKLKNLRAYSSCESYNETLKTFLDIKLKKKNEKENF